MWCAVWQDIVACYAQYCDACDFPPTLGLLRSFAKELAVQAKAPFGGPSGLPGKDWWQRFNKAFELKRMRTKTGSGLTPTAAQTDWRFAGTRAIARALRNNP